MACLRWQVGCHPRSMGSHHTPPSPLGTQDTLCPTGGKITRDLGTAKEVPYLGER